MSPMSKKGRANGLSSANGLICYLGHYQLGINWKELPRYFGISRPSVSKAIKRGEKFAKENNVPQNLPTGLTSGEIGKIFKMKAQAVSKAGIKIERLMEENRKIRSQVNKLISIFEG